MKILRIASHPRKPQKLRTSKICTHAVSEKLYYQDDALYITLTEIKMIGSLFLDNRKLLKQLMQTPPTLPLY